MKRAFVCRGRYQSLQRYTVTVDQHLHFETMRFFLALDSDFAIHRESLSRTLDAGLVSTGSTGQMWTRLRDGSDATSGRVVGIHDKTLLGAQGLHDCVSTANQQH